jgi:hypothetical protein
MKDCNGDAMIILSETGDCQDEMVLDARVWNMGEVPYPTAFWAI